MSDRSRQGFTLIEVLLSTSVFALLAAAVASGLISGTRTWDRIDRRLSSGVSAMNALDAFQHDLEFVAADRPQDEMAEALGFSSGEDGQMEFHARLAPSNLRRDGAPEAAVTVRWALRMARDGSREWVRITSTDGVSDRGETEQVWVTGVREVAFETLIGNEWRPVLDLSDESPDLIRVTLRLADGREFFALGSPWGGGRPRVASN